MDLFLVPDRNCTLGAAIEECIVSTAVLSLLVTVTDNVRILVLSTSFHSVESCRFKAKVGRDKDVEADGRYHATILSHRSDHVVALKLRGDPCLS